MTLIREHTSTPLPDVSMSASVRTRSRRGKSGSALLYVLPALILIVGVVYASLGYTGYISLFDWDGLSADREFVGVGNFIEIGRDPIFWTALRNVVVFAFITVLVQMAVGLGMAFLLQGRLVAGRAVFKVLLFLPVVLAPAVVATSFRNLLKPDGAVNAALEMIGLGALRNDWLSDPSLALISLSAINVWAATGYSFVLYQAALSQIDPALYEAAQMDGAGPIRILAHIVSPQLTGTHVVLIILGFMGSLKMFDLVYLTTGGGPGRSTEMLTTYIYKQAVNQFHSGYSAALSVILVVLALAFAIVQMRIAARRRG